VPSQSHPGAHSAAPRHRTPEGLTFPIAAHPIPERDCGRDEWIDLRVPVLGPIQQLLLPTPDTKVPTRPGVV
jgi:hypothetical protein